MTLPAVGRVESTKHNHPGEKWHKLIYLLQRSAQPRNATGDIYVAYIPNWIAGDVLSRRWFQSCKTPQFIASCTDREL